MSEASSRVLIAEDDPVSGRLLEIALAHAGFDVRRADNGETALALLKQVEFGALVTDWLMPEMDGIELCRRLRAEVPHRPAVIMLTALASQEARSHALASGADDFLGKPSEPAVVAQVVRAALARRAQPSPSSADLCPVKHTGVPPFVALGVAASTGGPAALGAFLSALKPGPETCVFVVQHGPAWMMEDLVKRLRERSALPVELATSGVVARAGHVFVAPGERHMVLDSQTGRIRLLDTAPENYVKPAADPLFKSLVVACGRFTIGVVLTGLGRDGALGAAAIAGAGGAVFVQEPADCVAPHMPQTVLDFGVTRAALPLAALSSKVGSEAKSFSLELEGERQKLEARKV